MRRVAALLATAVLAVTVVPAQAAPRSARLWFGDAGRADASGCSPVHVLSPRRSDGRECTGTLLLVERNGFVLDERYRTRGQSFRVDARRRLTGAVWVQHVPVVNTSPDPLVPALPGWVELDITVWLDKVRVGTVHVEGFAPPASGIEKRFSFRLPRALHDRRVRGATAQVRWTTAAGPSAISYTGRYASFLVVPVR